MASNRGRPRGSFAPSTGQFEPDHALRLGSGIRPSAVLADLVQIDWSTLQIQAVMADFLLLLESALKR
jgi:hypothetical protein